jgi:flagellar basal body-associated protein FliL
MNVVVIFVVVIFVVVVVVLIVIWFLSAVNSSKSDSESVTKPCTRRRRFDGF